MTFSKVLFAAFAAAAVAGCGGGSSTGGLDAEATYEIALTQSQEVPAPKPTTASGEAVLIIYPSTIDFQVSAKSIVSVTMAHIHSGAPGVAGPILATLYQTNSPISPNGIFTNGTLTDVNLSPGVTIASLKAVIASGNTYVNVHTTANPNGEIRGQIK
jgi:hypothetical protein